MTPHRTPPTGPAPGRTPTRRAVLRTTVVGAAVGLASTAMGGVTRLAVAGARPASGSAATIDVDEPRYLGYLPADRQQPYARFMEPATAPMQEQVVAAYGRGAVAPGRIPPLRSLAAELNRPGYSDVENGYGTLADGRTVWAAALTRMPGVTAAMWDWWFGWHSTESARYRLWHPDAHAYCAIERDLSSTPGLTDRQRYVGNTSYVDEFVGGQLEQLAISFLDPVAAGFHTSATTTVVYGVVGSSQLPVTLGYLAHQVRPVPGGSEMRSRFYLNVPGTRAVNPVAALAAHRRGDGPALAQPLPFDVFYARGLMEHCGREMNHLARFLPELHRDQARSAGARGPAGLATEDGVS